MLLMAQAVCKVRRRLVEIPLNWKRWVIRQSHCCRQACRKALALLLGAASKLMSSGISSWQEKQKELADLKDTKNSIEKIGGTDKPSFKVNPMRGLPFKKRIVKQYSWQPTPASADGSTPAYDHPICYGWFQAYS